MKISFPNKYKITIKVSDSEEFLPNIYLIKILTWNSVIIFNYKQTRAIFNTEEYALFSAASEGQRVEILIDKRINTWER